MAVVFTKEVEVNEGSSVNICMAFKNPVVFFFKQTNKDTEVIPCKISPCSAACSGF